MVDGWNIKMDQAQQDMTLFHFHSKLNQKIGFVEDKENGGTFGSFDSVKQTNNALHWKFCFKISGPKVFLDLERTMKTNCIRVVQKRPFNEEAILYQYHFFSKKES